jgi:aconitate hydratase
MAPDTEGGVTIVHPGGEQMSIYDASIRYQGADVPLVVFAGQEYGTARRATGPPKARGCSACAPSSRKASSAFIAQLGWHGRLPCQFKEGVSAKTLDLDGSETFDLLGLDDMTPRQDLTLVINRANGEVEDVPVTSRIDTPIEIEYFRHGGILPYVLRQLVAGEETSIATQTS